MKTLTIFILTLLLLASTAQAAGPLVIETHPNNAALICYASFDGYVYGNCGGGQDGAAGRGLFEQRQRLDEARAAWDAMEAEAARYAEHAQDFRDYLAIGAP